VDATDTWEPQAGVPLPLVQGAKADAILAELVSERGAPYAGALPPGPTAALAWPGPVTKKSGAATR
jgi:hypothetical protein